MGAGALHADQRPNQPPRPPPAESVQCVQVDRDSGILTFELRNGVLVHFRRTPGATGVSVCATLAGVDQMEGDKTRGLSTAALATIAPRLSLHTRMAGGTPEGVRVYFTGPRTQLEANARLIGEVFSSPTVSGAAINEWKARYIRVLTEPISDPATVATRALQDLLAAQAPSDARRRPVTPADIQMITPEAAVAWQRRLWAELPIEVGVSADLPVQDVVPPVIEALSAVPARPPGAWQRLADLRRAAPAPARKSIEVQAGLPLGEAIVLVAIPAPDLGDIRSHRTMVLAKAIINARLPGRLQAAGLHLAEGGLSLALSPGRGLRGTGMLVITARLRGEPDCALIGAKVIKDVVRELGTPGAPSPPAPTAAEVLSHAGRIIDETQPMLADPTYWANVLSVMRAEGWSPVDLVRSAEAYRAITPADIARVVGACIVEDRMYTVVLTPAAMPGDPLGLRP